MKNAYSQYINPFSSRLKWPRIEIMYLRHKLQNQAIRAKNLSVKESEQYSWNATTPNSCTLQIYQTSLFSRKLFLVWHTCCTQAIPATFVTRKVPRSSRQSKKQMLSSFASQVNSFWFLQQVLNNRSADSGRLAGSVPPIIRAGIAFRDTLNSTMALLIYPCPPSPLPSDLARILEDRRE